LQQQNGQPFFSASDLVAFLECEHATPLVLQAGFLTSLKAKGLRGAEIGHLPERGR
jgi:hypothetical protein